jgi:hypothetical protein
MGAVGQRIRVTHLDVNRQGIEQALDTVKQVMSNLNQ